MLSIFVLFSTGSFLAVMVLWATILLIFIVLLFYDIIDIDTLLPYEPPKEDDTPQPSNAKLLGQTIGSEVFHVSDQQFVYDEARAVCAAYDSELATLEQIMEAFAGGAEWCSYGWSAGGMALYPTQKATWQLLQNEVDPGRRTRCGRPGVNGGYFDPSNKFGVNCFGFKPKGNFKPPAPVPGADTKKFNEMVKRFKNMMKAFTMDPYSRQEWSGYDSTGVKQAYEYGQKVVEGFMGRSSGYGLQFAQDLGGLVKEGMTNQNPYYEPIDSASSQKFPAQGPYGLRGDLGPTGIVGPTGTVGAAGPVGPTGPAVNPDTLSFNTVKIGNWDIKAQGDELLFDDRTTNEDDATMFKINRTSGSSMRNSTTTSTGTQQQQQQDPGIPNALNQIQEAINMLRSRIDEKVEDGRGFEQQALHQLYNAIENNTTAQTFAEQNQPTGQFVMMANVFYDKIVTIRDRVLDNYFVARDLREALYYAVEPQFNTSYEVRTKFEALNAVVTETQTISERVNGYMYEAQSYKANVESIHNQIQQQPQLSLEQQQQEQLRQQIQQIQQQDQQRQQQIQQQIQQQQQQLQQQLQQQAQQRQEEEERERQQAAEHAAWVAELAAQDAAANANNYYSDDNYQYN